MCWKYEWAMAVNNLNYAIAHVEKARAKLHKRRLRNEKHLRMLKRSEKHNYPGMLTPVQALIDKNCDGELGCKLMIDAFKEAQNELRHMIKAYGIKRSKSSRWTKRLMNGRSRRG